MEIQLLFNLSNSIFLMGTLLLIRRVVINKDKLKDFDAHGSLLNFIGMIISSIALIELKLYTSLLISIPTILFWMIVSIYSFNNNKNKKK